MKAGVGDGCKPSLISLQFHTSAAAAMLTAKCRTLLHSFVPTFIFAVFVSGIFKRRLFLCGDRLLGTLGSGILLRPVTPRASFNYCLYYYFSCLLSLLIMLTIGCRPVQYCIGYVSKARPLERFHVGLIADVAAGGGLGLTRHILPYCGRLASAVYPLPLRQPPRLPQLPPHFEIERFSSLLAYGCHASTKTNTFYCSGFRKLFFITAAAVLIFSF